MNTAYYNSKPYRQIKVNVLELFKLSKPLAAFVFMLMNDSPPRPKARVTCLKLYRSVGIGFLSRL
ncbi:hypothetical protein SLEP1_g48238 [Rubroshorea leprosula]|uniref:Uncharacterized protein n=1 Tax=Rubroshorea leprosula TaxID=152421 RepID=A0AAV5LU38_9ROSI|nr:hypothetical protein SLEP1_g48238 [Rubroshorea leprosula]